MPRICQLYEDITKPGCAENSANVDRVVHLDTKNPITHPSAPPLDKAFDAVAAARVRVGPVPLGLGF